MPLFKRLINQSFPGVGQSVIFGKLTIDLAIISWQKKVSDEMRAGLFLGVGIGCCWCYVLGLPEINMQMSRKI